MRRLVPRALLLAPGELSLVVVQASRLPGAGETPAPQASMRHGIGHDIDPQGIRPFLREFLEITRVFAFTLPAVAQIGVVADDGHHPSLVVKDSLIMRLGRIRTSISRQARPQPGVNAG